MRGIFKDCLNMAEDNNLTSISLSAIGAGNLGFPKDLVASLLLDKILEFSKKKHPKHLKKVVIVLYPSDTQTIQVRKNNNLWSNTFSVLTRNLLGQLTISIFNQ